MKKSSGAEKHAPTQAAKTQRPGHLKDHDHVHAANCGHKSYVHGDHVDYEHDGHYHFTEGDRTYECAGPNAQVIQFPKNNKKK